MQKQQKQRNLAKRARKFWEQRDLSALESLRREPQAETVSEVQYFLGLALYALNKRRDAIQCWRRATELDPRNEDATRTLAYELVAEAPSEAEGLFFFLVGMQRATADDFTCLGEMFIRQDRLREARAWLQKAIDLDPHNTLALLALASLYAQVKDPSLALGYLKQAVETEEVDLSDVASDPEFEFLWDDPTFEQLVSANSRP
jgi:tetratricopeptide (TPR) repeat protein